MIHISEVLVERIENLDKVLVIQDTTSIDFTGHESVDGIGYLDNVHMRGLKIHSGIAVTLDGVPQGLLYQQIWARDVDEIGKSKE